MDQPPLIDHSNLPSPIFRPRPGWGGQLAAWFHHNTYRIVFRTVILLATIVIADALARSWTTVRLAHVETPAESAQSKSYEFVAAHGVGMTTLAARALDAYLVSQHFTLDAAEHLYAVDVMARQAGWRPLAAGQTVTFTTAAIGHIIIDAKALTPVQHTSWSRILESKR